MKIINDVHLGVNRQGGTTPASREALRSYLFGAFGAEFNDSDSHIVILGDLFDEFEVEGRDWVAAFSIMASWLAQGRHRKLTLVAGNHDWSAKGTKVSSFEMLCTVLKQQFPEHVQVIGIDQWAVVGTELPVIALAHCSNQDTFDARLKELLGKVVSGDRILLHANYDNGFAAQSDHSLNVSREQAKEFKDKGAFLYFAHEHQAREAFSGHVVVFGNQWPTSVSDCLGNDEKFLHVMTDQGVQKVRTWQHGAEAGYEQVPWELLAEYPTDGGAGFIRVMGSATANQAGDCISAIAKFRTKSSAFVVTNGVKIEGIAENSDLPEAFEATKAFDVMEFIDQNLDAAQRVAVAKLQAAGGSNA